MIKKFTFWKHTLSLIAIITGLQLIFSGDALAQSCEIDSDAGCGSEAWSIIESYINDYCPGLPPGNVGPSIKYGEMAFNFYYYVDGDTDINVDERIYAQLDTQVEYIISLYPNLIAYSGEITRFPCDERTTNLGIVQYNFLYRE